MFLANGGRFALVSCLGMVPPCPYRNPKRKVKKDDIGG
jgi:hypothetical protein